MVELLSGVPLFTQQFNALFKKNVILAWRNRLATFLQIFSSIFFIFLIFIIDKTTRAQFVSVVDPKPVVFPPIPPCEEKFFIKEPCYDFAWTGNSTKIATIVSRIMKNNPGREIPPHKVRQFRTPAEVDNWLFHDPMRCPGVLHFVERNATVISYGVQTNSSAVAKRGRYEDPAHKFQIPLQVAAEREIARFLIGDPNFSWIAAFKEFVHPAEETFSAVGTMGPIFFLAIAMFGFIFQIGSLVAEKELKLRQAMSIMGLYESSYWLSWLISEAIIGFLSSIFTVLFGMMFQFDFFLRNNFAVVFLVFFLFQINMIGFAFMISAFISKASSTTTVGFSIFIFSFLTQLVSKGRFPYNKETKKIYRILWSLFPPNLLAKALNILVAETSTPTAPGMSWHGHAKCSETDYECVITIAGIYKMLGGTFLLWFILAIYFDNIIPNSYGVRKSLFYFLNPGYWTGSDGGKVKEGGIFSRSDSIPTLENITPDDEDVREEENTVKKQAMEGYMDPNLAVQIQGLVKIYPGTTSISCSGKRTKTAPFHAVKGLWINFPKDQLFCLLGPNGAGKTTAISSLTGIMPVTAGDALIYGHSVKSSVGMSNIRKIIGVCPQFDILWDALTGKEHLHLFASIKGLPPSSIEMIAKNSLSDVKLHEAANRTAGSYSGGMKRRLSVAIALIGDPKLVILDEPTTGMDPITRRHVWDIIEVAKKGRAIVLTTHSMEEADILGDRIAIMAKGRLRCIGTSIRLKSRFGTGFIANVSFTRQTPNAYDTIAANNRHLDSVKNFFKQNLDVEPKEESKTLLTFVIPHDKEKLLKKFFAGLEDRKKEFGISDIQLGLTTLEEVFLNIAKKAELETAIQEGILVTLTLESGEEIEIPKGARFIGIPGTETEESPKGVMVEVYWGQDADGDLCIAGHSPQTPIPPNVLVSAPAGEGRTIRGFMIDPNEIEGQILQ
ncbi:ATP-binding cassette sub- A member 2 [Ranunculus cassubicifolius]